MEPTRIGITALRNTLKTVLEDVHEERRPFVIVTSGKLPWVAIVPVRPDGTLSPRPGDYFK